MNQDNLVLGIALKELDAFNLDGFDDRLLIQKKIYLAQEMGLNFGYNYNWYLAGPYCPSLTSDAYAVVPQGIEEFAEYKFNSEATETLHRINSFITEKPREMSEVVWYELLASLHFIIRKMGVSIHDSFSRLCMYKPKYSGQNKAYQKAIEVLSRVGLL